ncbi:uL15 family ribosomal protein [Candidatus Micrarchaeota archaeon]|nr:uL15 family ribosomal protein [Candidatus Micrarchaeota archaeon]
MPARKKKRIHSFRGSRHCGTGNIKNKRGSGIRGGVGNAGLKKHKFTWVTRYERDHFKRRKMKSLKPDFKILHLYEINQGILKNEITSKDGKSQLEFKGKILATGKLDFPVFVKAHAWSTRAEEKIKNAGGEISKLE